jgi:cytidine deaminase
MRKLAGLNLSDYDPKFVESISNLPAEELKDFLIEKVSLPLDDKDRVLVELAYQMAEDLCEEGRHHTVCVARGKSQEIYRGLQLNCSRAREHSVCAESGAIQNAAQKRDPVVSIVTVRYKPGRSDKAVVPPCGGCIERLRRFCPDSFVIVEYQGGLIKFPVGYLLSFGYPTKN